MRVLLPRLFFLLLTAWGVRQTLALLHIFISAENLRAPRAILAISMLPSLVAVALALVPEANANLAAAALFDRTPRRRAARAVAWASMGTIVAAFVAIHVAISPVYAARPLAVALVGLSVAAALGTFATAIASAVRFTSHPLLAPAILVGVTLFAEALAQVAPVGEVASTWLSPLRSLLLQFIAFDARPAFFLALTVHTALAILMLYGMVSERRFLRLAERTFDLP